MNKNKAAVPATAARNADDAFAIASVECSLLRVPLDRPIAGASIRPGAASQPFTTWDVISVTVTTRGGLTGWGFAYELRAGGEAVLAALKSDLAPLVIGCDAFSTERLWHQLYWATYNAGRRGPFIHAMAAIDIA